MDMQNDEIQPEANQLDGKQLEVRLIKIVAEKLNIEVKNITAASRFQEDLGADSLTS